MRQYLSTLNTQYTSQASSLTLKDSRDQLARNDNISHKAIQHHQIFKAVEVLISLLDMNIQLLQFVFVTKVIM